MRDKIIKRVRIRIKNYWLNVKVKISSGYVININQSNLLSEKYTYGFLKLNNVKKNKLEFLGPKGISLYEKLKNPISDYDIFSYVEQVVDVLRKIERIGLSRSNLVLDLKYIFINEATKELTFMYLPIATPHGGKDVLEAIEQIIYFASPVEKNSEYLSNFSHFIKKLDGFDANKIDGYISDTIKRKMISDDKTNGTVSYQPNISDEKTELTSDDEKTELMIDESTDLLFKSSQNDLKTEEKRILGIVGDENTCMLEDETTELLEEEKTDLLEKENVILYKSPALIRKQTDETVRINKPVFRIGKEEHCVDYVVADNAAISRSHADIISRNGRYFVLDLRSKNKTYINNRVLPTEQEVEIFDGDILRLANEDFLFQV